MSALLSDVTVFSKYARYLPELNRRENWTEITERVCQMHVNRFPRMEAPIREAFDWVHQKKVLPSMRSMQFGGRPILRSPNRLYNCSYLPINDIRAFREVMFLLLGGSGVGYSVQSHHIRQLPQIQQPGRAKRFLIGDSIEGWADAVHMLCKAYFTGAPAPLFDYQDIRAKGSLLKTTGGRAPGPAPLKKCLEKMREILDDAVGRALRPIEAHDILCVIADAVLSGGIRRAAMISLFSLDDQEMMACKSGNWRGYRPERSRANNSVVLLRQRVSYDDLCLIWERLRASGHGEPGVYLTYDPSWGSNPCCEIALRPFQFCNLTTINGAVLNSQHELEHAASRAAFIGTLQASMTDFHYLRPVWRHQTEKDALLGVSITGIARDDLDQFDFRAAAGWVERVNASTASEIGINPAARLTCIKPEGTASLAIGTTSGVHAGHAQHYIRRLRFNKTEAIARFFQHRIPEFVEQCVYNENDVAVSFPVELPEHAVTTQTENTSDFLARIKKLSEEWVKPGHKNGLNTHNVSCTVNVRESEWDDVRDWVWEHRNSFNGMSFLPENHQYEQAVLETIDKETYDDMASRFPNVDLANVIEHDDQTKLAEELACAGGACEI